MQARPTPARRSRCCCTSPAPRPETVPEFGGHAEHSHDMRHYHFYTPPGMAPVDGPAFLREAAQLAGPGTGGASVALFLKGAVPPSE